MSNRALQKNKKTNATKIILITISILFIVVMLIIPLAVLVLNSLKDGFEAYKDAIFDEYTLKALYLTVLATVSAVAVNTFFGVFAAWAITKFKFRGKQFLTTLIDIPFAISPVIAGLVFILTFGRIGWANSFLQAYDIKIVFAVPGIILATIFVTFPFVSREIIPVLNAQGTDEEEAAAIMGASGFNIFRKITLPHIKWALIYGVVLCTARAMGEFGAVSVISGHLRGKTNTLPLHIEILYNQFKTTDAFAVSSILMILAVIILIIRNIVEHKAKRAGEN
ncbi:sulfate ABC transporter, inner membrane subunit CysW [Clostridium sp. DL-VIII]|uniref:sulfate ABC transporter permease subunit CysW n=1 Tax=Clostridium sp. DL-VIII TaxID=641107 RepID=UPI00023AF3B1|nr:sulfate ABC transporter permease subunit CysW [Clostridium sp. DL-VIII]EHI97178.1 sulfate ABC transporter, inner membrane subunit CysW [Clostridium sp. DL-VIII]